MFKLNGYPYTEIQIKFLISHLLPETFFLIAQQLNVSIIIAYKDIRNAMTFDDLLKFPFFYVNTFFLLSTQYDLYLYSFTHYQLNNNL